MQISYRETVERSSKQAPPGYDVYELLWQDVNRSTSTIHANTQQVVEGHSSLGHSLPDLIPSAHGQSRLRAKVILQWFLFVTVVTRHAHSTNFIHIHLWLWITKKHFYFCTRFAVNFLINISQPSPVQGISKQLLCNKYVSMCIYKQHCSIILPACS